MKKLIDSYTREETELPYISPFKGINKPRTLYKPEHCRVSAQYSVAQREDGQWAVKREAATANFLPPALDEESARKMLEWLVLNDGSVGVVIHWLNKGEFDPYFRMLDHLQLAVYGGAE